jgi:hypothetical protein
MDYDYYTKYLKYKMKYLNLLESVGGAPKKKTISQINSLTASISPIGKKTISRVSKKSLSSIDNLLVNKVIQELTKSSQRVVVSKKKNYSRGFLSGQIQWLIQFAGTENIMEAIIDNFTDPSRKVTIIKENDSKFKYNDVKKSRILRNVLYFKTLDGRTGHWIYFDINGDEHQSYGYGHQVNGTNQFCQTFALIYMLKDFGNTIFFDKLTSTEGKDKSQHAKIYGDNIKVAVSFWYYFIFEGPIERAWIIDRFKDINDEFITENRSNTRLTEKNELIAPKSADITEDLIKSKLQYIYDNSELIALNT